MNTRCGHQACRLLGGCLGLLLALGADVTRAQMGLPPPTTIASLKAESSSSLKFAVDENDGTLTWLQGSFAPLVAGDPVESAYAFLEKHADAFRVTDPRAEFSVMLAKKGLLVPTEHVYLEQRIQGIPVWGRRLGFHYDLRGRLYAVNGRYSPAARAGTLAKTPSITAQKAREKALEHLQNSPGKWPASVAPFSGADRNLPVLLNPQVPLRATLVYYPDSQGALRLSYLVTFFVDSPPGDWLYFVDARSGAIIFRLNNIQTSGPAVGSGLDLFNNVVSLDTFLDSDGTYKLVNATKPMSTQHSTHSNTTWQGCIEIRDAQHATSSGLPPSVGDNPVVYDPDNDNVFTYGGSDPKSNFQAAVQCATLASDAYDFFRDMWGRNSVDGLGLAMIGNIHWGVKFSNAMWTPTLKMTFFGDGSDEEWPHARSLDTITHEFTHGVTTFSVPPTGYDYTIQPGAINESLSDMAAAANDYDDWNYGEDNNKDGSASRRFDDPTAVAQPQPKDMYDFYLMPLQIDNGGVHYNSGIGNHFFYQFAERLPAEAPASDGRFTASKVAYRSYVYGAANPYAFFREFSQYLKQACIDLYGPGATFDALVEALDYVHMPQARLGGNDDWQLLLDNNNQPYFFTLTKVVVYGWPAIGVRFTRPVSSAKLKTIGICFQDIGSCSYKIWYASANTNGSPDESTLQLLADTFSSSSVRTDYIFTNFKLTNSISVASDFHIILELVSGNYGALTHDTGGTPTERSWFRYTAWDNSYQWYKTKEYFALYPQYYPAGFDPNLMVKVIYETTLQAAPAAPALSSPADGETLNNWQVTFSWNAVTNADRYFLEVNSSPAWASASRVYFASLTGASEQVSGFPLGVNYWRVYAGNADAWSDSSATRSFTQLASPPQLACSATELTPRVVRGENAANQSFEVWNSGNGTITYSITDDVDWLSVSPTNGTSTGERDTITVNYNSSALSAGSYTANIVVDAAGAVGSPGTNAVTLTVTAGLPVAGDFDGDGFCDPAMVDSSGNWYVWLSIFNYIRGGPYALSSAGATPLAADFDSDYSADPVWVDDSWLWTMRPSSLGYVTTQCPVSSMDREYEPVSGDFDGDNKADQAGMDSAGNWIVYLSTSGYGLLGPVALTPSGGTPLAADFDGDGKADPAVVDGSGNWTVRLSKAGYASYGPYALTGANRMAVAGDFDGDGLADPAAVDSSGYWIICLSRGGYAQQGPYLFTVP